MRAVSLRIILSCIPETLGIARIKEVSSFQGYPYRGIPLYFLEWYLTYVSFIIVLRIGFIDAPYTTQEASGFVTVSVGLIDPDFVLDRDFVVTLETNDIATIQNAARGNRRMSTIIYFLAALLIRIILLSQFQVEWTMSPCREISPSAVQ